MATKCTMLIQVGTQDPLGNDRRLAGFSETWYTAGAFSPAITTAFRTLATKRAALLPNRASIVGFRFQETDGITSGRSTTTIEAIPGASGADNDAPQIALKFDIDASAGLNQRIWIMRGVPDNQVDRGEYNPTVAFRAAVLQFFQQLGTQWTWRGQVLTNPPTAIFQVTAAGAITWFEAPGYVAGAMLRILRTVNGCGRQVGGVFKLATIAGDTGTLLGWNLGDTTNGKSRVWQITFPAVPTNITISPVGQVVVKKVGRPFSLYRGRQSVRRQA